MLHHPHRGQNGDQRQHDEQLDQREAALTTEPARDPLRVHAPDSDAFLPIFVVQMNQRRRPHQSLYFVPSSPVPSAFEYVVDVLTAPAARVRLVLQCERMPHSVECAIGSIGTRRRNLSLIPDASFAFETPSTSVSRSGG